MPTFLSIHPSISICLLFFFLSCFFLFFSFSFCPWTKTNRAQTQRTLIATKTQSHQNIKWKISKILFNKRCEEKGNNKKEFQSLLLSSNGNVLTQFSIKTNTGQFELMAGVAKQWMLAAVQNRSKSNSNRNRTSLKSLLLFLYSFALLNLICNKKKIKHFLRRSVQRPRICFIYLRN